MGQKVALPLDENKTPASQRCQCERDKEEQTERENTGEKASEFMPVGLLVLRDSLCDSWLRLAY